ncbi:MAG: hypothetical protein RJA70_433 [Pseudomonadota bacterium]|jgi:CheY-like chemotaxis protein
MPKAPAETELQGALHEISNALTVVLGWLEDARVQIPAGPGLKAVEVALAHARRGHTIARRAIGARVDSDSSVRSALSVAADAATATFREAEHRGTKIRLSDAESDAMVEGSDDILQILVNLLLNALSFSPKGSEVRMDVATVQAHVLFTVADQGPGVGVESRAKLFLRGNSMRPGGAGVGLAHSRELAAKHGASLSLLNGDAGAAFELRWPISDAPSQTVQLAPRSQSLSGMRLIVLEDDTAVMEMVQFGLEAYGAIVDAATNVAQLTELSNNGETYDAALVDFSPIQFDAPRVLGDLQAKKAGVPIILISGSAIAPDEVLPLAAWVQKPFELGELVRALNDLRS